MALAAGGCHTVALIYDGTVKAWGRANRGQLGDGTTATGKTRLSRRAGSPMQWLCRPGCPHRGPTLRRHSQDLGSKRLSPTGRWDRHGSIHPGHGKRDHHRSGRGGWQGNLVALLSDGTMKAWGDNCCGQLGDGTYHRSVHPCHGKRNHQCDRRGCRHAYTVALLSDGTFKTWGANYYGQLGDGTDHRSVHPCHGERDH